ncbi:alpha/beta fold hydrolase [Chitinibacter sp. SCUT-21]|uniref:alpha/beta hydrolase n=1 Tax=Chitinibacter sp. SCUT-21 TaxID=2970891 RepID=UPI0035A5C8C6
MLRLLLRKLPWVALGALIPFLVLAILWIKKLPELEIWHTRVPTGEFTRNRSDIKTLADYQALEQKLLLKVSEEIIAKTKPDQQRAINRFAQKSLTNPLAYPQNWNLTYQLQGGKEAVLLVHGLSDSPYSLHELAQKLHRQGYTVVGLRLPSHGTAPAALTRFKWQDAAAVVRLAMHDLAKTHSKIHYVGYSTGATLGCEYLLARLDGEQLPAISSVTFISPAIAVTESAKYAQWVRYLAPLSGVGAAAWSDIAPEYNPYKYNSFPLNAAVQMHELTSHIAAGFARHAPLKDWPPSNVFLSAVDSTVLPEPVVSIWMSKLVPGRHQLMLFDLNRYQEYSPLLNTHAADWALALANQAQARPYRLQFVSNRHVPQSRKVSIEDTAAGASQRQLIESDLAWPNEIFALSHIALPFSPLDPLFGDPAQESNSRALKLNQILIGERGLLQVGGGEILRLRYNPFYELQEREILRFIAETQ